VRPTYAADVHTYLDNWQTPHSNRPVRYTPRRLAWVNTSVRIRHWPSLLRIVNYAQLGFPREDGGVLKREGSASSERTPCTTMFDIHPGNLSGGSEIQPVNKLEHIGRGSNLLCTFLCVALVQAPLQTAANAAFLAQVYAQMRPGEDVDRHTCWAGEHSRHAHFDHVSGRL